MWQSVRRQLVHYYRGVYIGASIKSAPQSLILLVDGRGSCRWLSGRLAPGHTQSHALINSNNKYVMIWPACPPYNHTGLANYKLVSSFCVQATKSDQANWKCSEGLIFARFNKNITWKQFWRYWWNRFHWLLPRNIFLLKLNLSKRQSPTSPIGNVRKS